MTEFTKEELLKILEGVAWWFEGDDELSTEKLIDKIQSMIDHCDCNDDCGKKVTQKSDINSNEDWIHEAALNMLIELKNSQIDENRAVHKSLEEFREKQVSLFKGYQNQHSLLNELRKDLNEICHRLDKLENPNKLCDLCRGFANCENCGQLGVVS